jgi:hypothetical protein
MLSDFSGAFCFQGKPSGPLPIIFIHPSRLQINSSPDSEGVEDPRFCEAKSGPKRKFAGNKNLSETLVMNMTP